MALGALVAVGALLLDVGDPADVVDTMRNANWSWIALAIVISFASNIAYAVALQGTVQCRCRCVPTTELQVAMSFSNLAIPAIGGQGMQVRFLQKSGSISRRRSSPAASSAASVAWSRRSDASSSRCSSHQRT